MKKNALLLLILVLLAVFTYLFQEKGEEQQQVELMKKQRLFDPAEFGELQTIQLTEAKLINRKGIYFTDKGQRIVDAEKLNRFLDILSEVKVKRVLSKEEFNNVDRKHYFPNEKDRFVFTFENGKLEFLLGNKLEFGQEFYMEVTNKNKKDVVIAYSAESLSEVYHKEEHHRSDLKYRKVKSLLYIKEEFFFDTHVFLAKKSRPESITVSSFRNKAFKIFLQKMKTNPLPPAGIQIAHQNIKKYEETLRELKAATLYYPFDKKLLKDSLSEVVLTDKDGGQEKINIFRKYGSLEGYFLSASFSENLYELTELQAKPFFYNVQDFWQLNANWKVDKSFSVAFSERVFMELQLIKGRKFKVVMRNPDQISPINRAFSRLFQFLQSRAKRVSTLEKEDAKLKDRVKLFLRTKARELAIYFGENEIIVIDFENNYKLHYPLIEELVIGQKVEDYFL